MLPHQTQAGQCSPIHCAGVTDSQKKKRKKKAAEVFNTGAKQVHVEHGLAAKQEERVVALEDAEEETRLTRAQKRHAMKQKALGVPEKLEGAAAEEWADKRLVELLPSAVADVEWDLKYGDDAQRANARKQVLDATGRGKREMGGGGSQPIIMLVGTGVGPGAQPWLQRVDPKKIPGGENK